jgi:hypothetical protein
MFSRQCEWFIKLLSYTHTHTHTHTEQPIFDATQIKQEKCV